MMKKWGALLLMLALVASLLTACGEADPEKLNAKIVGRVNGEDITRGEAMKVYDYILAQTVLSAQEAGQSIDPTSQEIITSTKATAINVMTEGLALEQKLAEIGEALTDEDKAGFAAQAKEEYARELENLVASYGMDEQSAREYIDSLGYTEAVLEYLVYREEIETRLMAVIAGDVVISDEEVQAKYDELVSQAQARYADSPDNYVNDLLGGSAVYYNPEGFRNVKNIVISFPDEINDKITEKDNAYYDKWMEQYSATNELSTSETLTDDEKATLQATIDTATVELEAVQAEIKALEQQALEQIKPDAQAVVDKAREEGADFDALMAEYNSDSATGIAVERGYPVAEGVSGYVASFTEAAMALASIGDVSDLVESQYGYHILQYASDIQSGAVPLEEVRDDVTEQLRTAAETALLNEKMVEWFEAAKIKTNINNF